MLESEFEASGLASPLETGIFDAPESEEAAAENETPIG
jgi:hypothetical protein